MRAVVQRVSEAQVQVDGEVIGATAPGRWGLMVLVGAEDGDTDNDVHYLADKVCGLRIFEDDEGRMNRSVVDVEGSLLVISQFTLLGDCRKGRRPSFIKALEPTRAAELVEDFVARAKGHLARVETGRFRATMSVSLINEGPVTLLLDSRRRF